MGTPTCLLTLQHKEFNETCHSCVKDSHEHSTSVSFPLIQATLNFEAEADSLTDDEAAVAALGLYVEFFADDAPYQVFTHTDGLPYSMHRISCVAGSWRLMPGVRTAILEAMCVKKLKGELFPGYNRLRRDSKKISVCVQHIHGVRL